MCAAEEEDNVKKLMESEAPDPEADSSFGDRELSLLDQQAQKQERTQRNSNSQDDESFPTQPIQVDYQPTNIDELEELVESIIDEKWRSLIENFGDIGLWKDRVRTEIGSIKQELRRLENRFDNLQKAVLGKVTDYDKHMIEVGSEIKALEKVFEKIITPLTSNIKELEKITTRLKK